MPKQPISDAELAARASAATKVLKRAIASGAKAEGEASNRATGSRAKYKVVHDGAETALAILIGRQAPVAKPARKAPQNGQATPRKPRRTVDPVPARRVSGSAAAKSNVVPIEKAPSAPKKPSGRKVGGRAR